jgi:hypothetical protein
MKKLLALYSVFVTILLAATFYWYAVITFRVMAAEDQMATFEAVVKKHSASGKEERAEAAEYIDGYYPSGSKQTTGSRLDRVVEAGRRMSLRLLEGDLPRAKEPVNTAP